MKRTILTIATVAAILSGCNSSKAASDAVREEISWSAFCDARGYDKGDNTYLVINEYLDTWCGSPEEEQALIDAEIQPY